MHELVIERNRTYSKLNKHWQFSVGADHAKQAMRFDYLKQLKFIHDELGITYVRFHGIFCDDMHTLPSLDEVLPIPGVEGITERSFYYCGVVYDGILEIGMKPFVELSFMPSKLAAHKETGKLFYGANFSQPESYEAWTEHVSEFVKYLLHRYGKEEVESWYFEVWNEPDLQGAFFLGTQDEYFQLYKASVRAIKAVDSNLRVGGPATSGSRWVSEFLAFCEENNLPVDFVSTHQYSGDPLTGVSETNAAKEKSQDAETEEIQKLKQAQSLFASLPPDTTHLNILRMIMGEPSEREDIPNDRFRHNSMLVHKQAHGLPVIYDEWNFSAVLTDYGNDTRKAAAYLVKTALDVEQNITASSVWCFSDIFEEMHQFTEEFHGGFGLMTIHGIPKPSFYALKLLSSLADNRVKLDSDATDQEIGAAAFEDNDKLQLLLFRQKMKQANDPKEQISVKVALPYPPHSIGLNRIDNTHCNPLSIWESRGKQKDLNAKEIDAIISLSAMENEAVRFDYHDGMVTIAAELGVNDIHLYTILK